MARHHEPFQALGPVDWASIPPEKLPDLLAETFADAQTIIDSLPAPSTHLEATGSTSSIGRARSNTDPASPSAVINPSPAPRQSGASYKLARDLMKEWKEVKVNPRENPLSINVYKAPGKDGQGAWFARRSVHDGIPFEKWRLGLEREFSESMKVQEGPGSGCIRGISADRRIEHHVVDDIGKAEVFQLSAQFPGPTAPRDFVTLLLTSEATHNPPTSPSYTGSSRPLRSFMIVSKPCNHPDDSPSDGCIRGQYESVEVIREMPSVKPDIRRSKSSIDLRTNKGKGKHQPVPRDVVDQAVYHPDDAATDEDAHSTTIEWLMVTRSDPGGNVPRFMVERGTPGTIVSDADKFLKWLAPKSARDFASGPECESTDSDRTRTDAVHAEETESRDKKVALDPTSNLIPDGDDGASTPQETDEPHESDDSEATRSSNGLYGIISGALGKASAVVAGQLSNHLPSFYQNENNTSSEIITDDEQDEANSPTDDGQSNTSSPRSFISAVEPPRAVRIGDDANGRRSTRVRFPDDRHSPDDDAYSIQSNSNESEPSTTSKPTDHINDQYEKEFRKLEDRREKLHDKLARLQSRITSKREEESQKDDAALSKLRDKYEREMAKHEEKYRRELRRLEEKRESEERKAAQRRRKQAEREEKANIGLELQRVRAERDLALKQVEALTAQVGDLQAQNTELVAEMGRMNRALSPSLHRDSPEADTGPSRTAERQPIKGVRRVATSS